MAATNTGIVQSGHVARTSWRHKTAPAASAMPKCYVYMHACIHMYIALGVCVCVVFCCLCTFKILPSPAHNRIPTLADEGCLHADHKYTLTTHDPYIYEIQNPLLPYDVSSSPCAGSPSQGSVSTASGLVVAFEVQVLASSDSDRYTEHTTCLPSHTHIHVHLSAHFYARCGSRACACLCAGAQCEQHLCTYELEQTRRYASNVVLVACYIKQLVHTYIYIYRERALT